MTSSAVISTSDVNHLQVPDSSTSEMPNAGTPGLIYEISDHDVLLGRGTGPNESQGNIRFRALVRRVLQEVDPSKLDGKIKAKIAREILNAVKAENGRFLKISSDGSSTSRCFSVVPDIVALDKIKQSFRHQLCVLENAVSKRQMIATGGRDYVDSTGANVARSTAGSLFGSHYNRQAERTPSFTSLSNTSSTACLASSSRNNLSFVRDHLEQEILANALASQAVAASMAANRTMRESALSNALMAAERRVNSSSIAELVNALATAKADAALRRVSALPQATAHARLASLFRNSEDAPFAVGNAMMSPTGLGSSTSRSSFPASSGLNDLDSRLAAALGVVSPSSHRHQYENPHYLEMILRRGS